MVPGLVALYLGQSQTLSYPDVFFQSYATEGLSKVPRLMSGRSSRLGRGKDTEWPHEAMPAALPNVRVSKAGFCSQEWGQERMA